MSITVQELMGGLNTCADVSDKKDFLDKHFADIIDELLALDEFEREMSIDRILNAFNGTKLKGSIKKIIESNLANHLKQQSKKKGAKFTNADLSAMMDKKGSIAYTTSHVIDIIKDAIDVKLVLDTMSEQPYFIKMPWISLTNEFKLPLMTNGHTHIYYPYDNINRTSLKKTLNDNIFPDEKHWIGLDDVVEIVSHYEKIDMYQELLLSLPSWDKDDRVTNPNTNWVVRYLKAEPGLWSAAWARMLPLSQVWRCFNPGCRQRYYFAIEGNQNIGKTSFCKALLPVNPYEPDNSYWYVSTSIKNIDKDFLQLVAPGAVIEFPDLDMNRFNLNDWKRFITETDVTLRLPYGRLVTHHPKRSICIVTTNEHRYLRDPTGETRAIPIKSLFEENEFIDHKGFRAEYPQILAQIKEQYYLKGIEPYLTREEMNLQKEQIEIRDIVHEWAEWEHVEEMIGLNPDYQNKITIKDIVTYIITSGRAMSEVSITQAIRNRYGQVLRKMGYESKRETIGGKTYVVFNR
jgi:predicted P-loop ATPase